MCLRYGGGEQYDQPWPIEQLPKAETAYVTGDFFQSSDWYGGVTEAYWVSSTGLAVVVSQMVIGVLCVVSLLGLLHRTSCSGESQGDWCAVSCEPTGSPPQDFL